MPSRVGPANTRTSGSSRGLAAGHQRAEVVRLGKRWTGMERAKARKPLVVDLAHRGETVSQALAKLDAAVSECVWHGHPALKVIHGHGGGVSRIKPQVLAALRKHADRLGAVMEQDGDNPGANVLRMR